MKPPYDKMQGIFKSTEEAARQAKTCQKYQQAIEESLS